MTLAGRLLQAGAIWLAAASVAASAFAADVAATAPAAPTAASSALRMTIGLLVVLAVMALISWLIKRFTPGRIGRPTVAKIVGGVSVGSRERVVVVEVAGRWIVVGVAPGQVNALANLKAGSADVELTEAESPKPAFAGWLKRSLEQAKPPKA